MRSNAAAGTPKGWANKRKHFIAVQMDGAHRLSSVAPLLDSLVKEVQRDPTVGIGLVSMLGFEDTAKALKAGAIPLSSLRSSPGKRAVVSAAQKQRAIDLDLPSRCLPASVRKGSHD